MKYLKFLFVGVLFGVVLTKAEVVSWFRIYEMFKFQSFHMYGVIGSAVAVGIVLVWFIKKYDIHPWYGEEMCLFDKKPSIPRYLFGGIIFGLGWAMTGACPGPMFILLGYGVPVIAVVIASALLGTLAYGMLRDKIPH